MYFLFEINNIPASRSAASFTFDWRPFSDRSIVALIFHSITLGILSNRRLPGADILFAPKFTFNRIKAGGECFSFYVFMAALRDDVSQADGVDLFRLFSAGITG